MKPKPFTMETLSEVVAVCKAELERSPLETTDKATRQALLAIARATIEKCIEDSAAYVASQASP